VSPGRWAGAGDRGVVGEATGGAAAGRPAAGVEAIELLEPEPRNGFPCAARRHSIRRGGGNIDDVPSTRALCRRLTAEYRSARAAFAGDPGPAAG